MQLHHLRSVSERVLFRRGRGMWGMAALWFGGGLGLAGFPLFLLMRGDAFTEAGAKLMGISSLSMLFAFSGALTAAAVFRTGMHTFFGWGTLPLADDAADIPERPDTTDDGAQLRWYHYLPPSLCLVAGVAFTPVRSFLSLLAHAGGEITDQTLYFAHTYGRAANRATPEIPEAHTAFLVGLAATTVAALIALSSVFHLRLPKSLRLGVYLEHGFTPLRTLHSGHAADYVTWLTAGVSLFGTILCLAFR